MCRRSLLKRWYMNFPEIVGTPAFFCTAGSPTSCCSLIDSVERIDSYLLETSCPLLPTVHRFDRIDYIRLV